MQNKVERVTQVLFEEGNGNAEMTAQILANFTHQRVIKPFVRNETRTPQEIFGNNALATVVQAKKVSRKPGCQADMFRRQIIVAGASGPMSPNDVCARVICICCINIIMFEN